MKILDFSIDGEVDQTTIPFLRKFQLNIKYKLGTDSPQQFSLPIRINVPYPSTITVNYLGEEMAGEKFKYELPSSTSNSQIPNDVAIEIIDRSNHKDVFQTDPQSKKFTIRLPLSLPLGFR